jgi:hypothetical protein
VGHHHERPFEPESFYELGERLSNQDLEHAVKVKWRQPRGTRYVREPQRLTEVTHDVIDGQIDPFGVRHRGRGAGLHTVRKIWQAFLATIGNDDCL